MSYLNKEEIKKIFREYKDCYDIILNMITHGVSFSQLQDLEIRLKELFQDYKIGLPKARMLDQKFTELFEKVEKGTLPPRDIEEILLALGPARQKIRDSLDIAIQKRLACNR